jgi:dUTP pyrophosphatase
VLKLRSSAKLPTRAHQTDAGLDLYYCPNGERESVVKDEGLAIYPRESVLIPTGIRVEVPYGYMLEIKNKSGIAFKKQLIVGACVIDPGYTGEVYVNLHNIGITTRYIKENEKIAQAVLVSISHCHVEEIEDEATFDAYSSRGPGGFGSTGNI